MKPLIPPAVIACAAVLCGCASGNVRSANSYNAPAPPPIKSFYYDPYAAYGSSNATWRPLVYDRQGTIVKPDEPSSQGTRPDYESAQWATGASGSNRLAPAGTF
jgi:hypothetical protein